MEFTKTVNGGHLHLDGESIWEHKTPDYIELVVLTIKQGIPITLRQMLDSGDILIQVDTAFAVAGGYNSVEHMEVVTGHAAPRWVRTKGKKSTLKRHGKAN